MQVIDAIRRDGWEEQSHFRDFMRESSTFPTAPPSPRADHKPSQPSKEDLAALERIFQQLQAVDAHLKQIGEDTTHFASLINFLKGVRKVTPSLSLAQQFDRLQPLRKWVLWLPVFYLLRMPGSPSALLAALDRLVEALRTESEHPGLSKAS